MLKRIMKIKNTKALDLNQQLCFAAYTASRLISQAYQPNLKKLGITYPQYLVLLVLWSEETQSIKNLGSKLRLDSGTLSPLIQKLQTKGLVAKSRLAQDERIVTIELTTKGRALKKSANKIPGDMFCKLQLDEKRFANLRTELFSVINNLS